MRTIPASLKRLVTLAAKAQEHEHNDPRAPSAEGLCKAVERAAARLGWVKRILWPGLYPVLVDVDGYYHYNV